MSKAPQNPLQRKTPKPQPLVTDPRVRPVKVKLVADDEKPNQAPWLELHVGSLVKRNAWAVVKIDANREPGEIRKTFDKAANLACDFLGRNHGDMLNSSEVAKAALEALDEVFAIAAQAQRGGAPRRKR